MSTDAKAIVGKFWESWNKGDWEALKACVDAGYVHHVGEERRSLADFRQGTARVLGSMPDYRITPQTVTGDGDTVAVRWIGRGTHKAPYMGEAPTNKEIVIHGMHFHRVANGRIVEDWEIIDNFSVAQQVGLIPGG